MITGGCSGTSTALIRTMLAEVSGDNRHPACRRVAVTLHSLNGMSTPARLALLAVALTVTVATVSANGPPHQQLPTDQLLARTAQYVGEFVTRFANVVAEERYVQRLGGATRRLTSDFHFVKFPGATEWLQFRDVIEVDGKPVGEEERGRATRLVLGPAQHSARRMREIVEASARHNLVNVGTANVPLLALSILQEPYQDRFRFTPGGADRELGASARILRFEEVRRPTILRTGSQNDQPIRG